MDIEHQSGGGGWISGPSTTTPHRDLPDAEPLGSEIEAGTRHAADTRPAFAPAALVFEVMDVLSRVGIKINPAPGQLHVASLAAADLLRALGVAPANAPERRA